jgi:REP element-mobilizing transposase RayT
MYHIIWIAKYRRRVLKGKVANRLKQLFHQYAEINAWRIDELNITHIDLNKAKYNH